MAREIPLTKGHFAIVDDQDYKALTRWKWSYSNGYAVRKTRTETGTKSLGMHQQIMNTPAGMVTDHINHDRLDNRRKNLRICTYGQNTASRPADKDNLYSAYKGVSKDVRQRKKPWNAQIRLNGKRHWLGSFRTEKAAARAYNRAAVKIHGQYAWLNKVE